MSSFDQRIFVAIASYCDPVLPFTLDNCLAQARHPEHLRFGICRQYDPQQRVNVERFKADPRFVFRDFHASESEGGSWARCIAQELWDGEAFTLQVDSHMAFAPGWDAALLRMMREFPSDKPLITMNAPLFNLDEEYGVHRSKNRYLRATTIGDWSEKMGATPWFVVGCPVEYAPARSRFVSGNFAFAAGQWTEEVRQDPQHYYWGEEFALTLRSFTHGYDLFLPDETVAWHMHHVDGPPRRHWENGHEVVQRKNDIAFERFQKLVYSDDPRDNESLGRFGLGDRRSRADYERFSGMCLASRTAHPDVFHGRPPDPVTIHKEADWDDCISCEAYKSAIAAQRRPQSAI